MTADDMEKMAEHAEYMAEWCEKHNERDSGLVGYMLHMMGQQFCESARWWREQRGKADLR